ncbi:hypothetical protein PDE_00064 [Penicillium oxalicum 114-2]|uniref:Uncharacterized protein n=1 Tax=Penicillium oxalicum (strain 114-2 / CGMCC 5302) TaxID=933388 RepID=S8AHC3_PENO1|nr:hypothetical protein PDE_00064 [Penicillium oxalicum 114-2]
MAEDRWFSCEPLVHTYTRPPNGSLAPLFSRGHVGYLLWFIIIVLCFFGSSFYLRVFSAFSNRLSLSLQVCVLCCICRAILWFLVFFCRIWLCESDLWVLVDAEL